LLNEATQQQRGEAGLRRVFAAGQGAMTMTVIGPTTAAALLADVMTGDAGARTVLEAADRLLRQIQRRSRARALPCLICDDNALWRGEPPAAIAVLTPFGIEPVGVAIGLAFCAGARRIAPNASWAWLRRRCISVTRCCQT
jgi:hypothetical protein